MLSNMNQRAYFQLRIWPDLQQTIDLRTHLSLKDALRSKIGAQWLMEAWTYSLHPREEEAPRRFLTTPEDDSGWRRVTSVYDRRLTSLLLAVKRPLEGARAPRFKTFLFIKLEAWNLVRMYKVKWYTYMWANSPMARQMALAGGRRRRFPHFIFFLFIKIKGWNLICM